MTKENTEITDIVEIIRNGPSFHTPMFEQERNFDAVFTPTRHEWKNVSVEWIDGKKYNVYS